MINIVLTPEKEYVAQSSIFSVQSGNKYSISSEIIGISGDPFCGYVGVIIFDKNNNEITRKIQWLNDFTNVSKIMKIIFKAPESATHVVGIYRINNETPMKSYCRYQIQPPDNFNIVEVDPFLEESYDTTENYVLRRSRELTFEETFILEKKLVWLLSTPRSGTTWMGERLLLHPENVIWSEPLIGFHLGAFTIDEVLFGELSFDRSYDKHKKRKEYFFSLQQKNNWLPELKQMILHRAYSHNQNLRKNIVIKEPNGGHAADIIMECFPNSKLILLIRDGRDVLDSRMAMHGNNTWARLPPLKNHEERKLAIRWYSAIWNRTMEWIYTAYQKHDTKLRLLIKYEDLKNNTFDELEKIYKFLDIKIEDNDLKEIIEINDFANISSSEKGPKKFNRTALVGGWKNNFSKEEQELMNSIMEKKLLEMGYEV